MSSNSNSSSNAHDAAKQWFLDEQAKKKAALGRRGRTELLAVLLPHPEEEPSRAAAVKNAGAPATGALLLSPPLTRSARKTRSRRAPEAPTQPAVARRRSLAAAPYGTDDPDSVGAETTTAVASSRSSKTVQFVGKEQPPTTTTTAAAAQGTPRRSSRRLTRASLGSRNGTPLPPRSGGSRASSSPKKASSASASTRKRKSLSSAPFRLPPIPDNHSADESPAKAVFAAAVGVTLQHRKEEEEEEFVESPPKKQRSEESGDADDDGDAAMEEAQYEEPHPVEEGAERGGLDGAILVSHSDNERNTAAPPPPPVGALRHAARLLSSSRRPEPDSAAPPPAASETRRATTTTVRQRVATFEALQPPPKIGLHLRNHNNKKQPKHPFLSTVRENEELVAELAPTWSDDSTTPTAADGGGDTTWEDADDRAAVFPGATRKGGGGNGASWWMCATTALVLYLAILAAHIPGGGGGHRPRGLFERLIAATATTVKVDKVSSSSTLNSPPLPHHCLHNKHYQLVGDPETATSCTLSKIAELSIDGVVRTITTWSQSVKCDGKLNPYYVFSSSGVPLFDYRKLMNLMQLDGSDRDLLNAALHERDVKITQTTNRRNRRLLIGLTQFSCRRRSDREDGEEQPSIIM